MDELSTSPWIFTVFDVRLDFWLRKYIDEKLLPILKSLIPYVKTGRVLKLLKEKVNVKLWLVNLVLESYSTFTLAYILDGTEIDW